MLPCSNDVAIAFCISAEWRVLDWNDLRYFLAVAETGSTLAAGRMLRVSQTTAARRIAALEAALAMPLFDRRQTGYALTAGGEALVGHARAVAAATAGFTDAAAATRRETSGTVKLTTETLVAVTILPAMLRELNEAHPSIRIDLETTSALRDLSSGAADVALRSTRRPEGQGLVGRRVAWDEWTIYASRAYIAAHGQPHNRKELRGHKLIGGGGEEVWRQYEEWLKRNALEDLVVMQFDSASGLLSAVRSGFGLAVLPLLVADQDPDLVRCLPPMNVQQRGLWLLTHQRLRHVPRVRIVLDFLGERLTALARSTNVHAEPLELDT